MLIPDLTQIAEREISDADPAWLGPLVWLLRLRRDGEATVECLREFYAELLLADIPRSEPNTARAMIWRGNVADAPEPWGDG